MKLGKIVALTGIQSGGKSTMALDLVSALKKRSINAWHVLDVARTTTLPRHADGGPATQEAIAHRMAVALLETAAKHDVVITDRSLFDTVAYNIACGCPMNSSSTNRLYRMNMDFVMEYFTRIYVVRGGFDLHADGDRVIDQEFYDKSVAAFEETYTRVAEDLSRTTVRVIGVDSLKLQATRVIIQIEVFQLMGI